MSDTQNHALLQGTITFVENQVPALLVGEYTIRVAQHLKNTNPLASSDQRVDEVFYNEKKFAISGAERFSLKREEVYHVFPPDNQEGAYDNVLPHVVLKSQTLPWLRSPGGTDTGKPWLALLLFEASELQEQSRKYPDRPVELGLIKVGDLQRADFLPEPDAAQKRRSTLHTDTVSYPGLTADQPTTTDGLDDGENWYDSCRALDIPIDLFQQIAPALSSAVGPNDKGDLELLT
ncbi:MAG: hypothetical protein AAF840_15010, partial [Bacteroidota bacterium]